MEKIKLVETFDNTPAISLMENKNESISTSRVDGKYIIGMIEGQFFKPDGMSRNKRWYPRSLWEKVLNTADVKNRFNSSTMFGEIGHSDGPVEDMTLRQGCASHFIDKLWIDENGRGMGRAYILNTPTGQLLKTYLGAGCKLKVSTRGEGMYKEGCTHDGCPVIDDDTYDLQTADFVINPGFIETSAILKEEYEKVNKEYSLQQKEQIEETIAHVKKEGEKRMDLNIDAYVTELKAERDALRAENKSLNESLQAKEKELLQKQFNESAEVEKLKEELKPFKDFKVSAKSLNETFKKVQNTLKKEKEAKAKIAEELDSYKAKCGTLEDISLATKLSAKSLQIIEEYRKYGTPEEFKEAQECLAKSLKMIKELKEVAFKAAKVIPQLTEAKKLVKNAETACKLLEDYHKQGVTIKANEEVKNVKNEALEMSKKYNVTVESAAKLINKNGKEEAEKLIESVIAKKSEKIEVKEELQDSKKLVEEEAKSDVAPKIEAEKTAKDFLRDGVVTNYFNHAALGKELKLDVEAIDQTSKNIRNTKELFKKYQDKFEVEKAPEDIKKELTPEQTEAEVKKLLKK